MLFANSYYSTYRFAISSSLYVSLSYATFMLLYHFVFGHISWVYILLSLVVQFIICVLIIQYRIEHTVYKSLKKAYQHIIGVNTDSKEKIINAKTFTDEIRKYTANKKSEIDVLKTRDNYRREFIGNVSHELKTPLFTIQGYLETLIDGAMKDENILEKYLHRAAKGVDRLTYIVKDLDMIAKLELGSINLNYKVFDLVELIKSIFELLEIKASEKQISLVFDKPYESVKVYADNESISQVVTNLVVNSIKYGKQKGTTEICIEDTHADKINIKISDNGEGIEQQYISRIFERFFRVEKSRSRIEGGSGLGLAIVKHILEAHSQTITVNSEFGVGTEFSFTLNKANSAQIIQKQFNQLIKS